MGFHLRLREGAKFVFLALKDVLGMIAGNLSVHLTELEKAGYVRTTKTHKGRTPVTISSRVATGVRSQDGEVSGCGLTDGVIRRGGGALSAGAGQGRRGDACRRGNGCAGLIREAGFRGRSGGMEQRA